MSFIYCFYSILVCKAGYYKNGYSCSLCSGNDIKSAPGNATNCSADQLCDSVSSEPNTQHTACGLFTF